MLLSSGTCPKDAIILLKRLSVHTTRLRRILNRSNEIILFCKPLWKYYVQCNVVWLTRCLGREESNNMVNLWEELQALHNL